MHHKANIKRVLIAGANGYIGRHLIPLLAEQGIEVIALVRSPRRLPIPKHLESHVSMLTGDLLHPEKISFPSQIDAAYYLVHSMSTQSEGFSDLEAKCAQNFAEAIKETQARQIIYLSGISHEEQKSEHMFSRQQVEDILRESKIPLTVLRAAIIIGAGSASFEIIRDLVEKLPVLITPKWVGSRCQPIAITDVMFYLQAVLGSEKSFNRVFEIGGPEQLSYRKMLLRMARVRGLHRFILPVPFLTPHLSSYWLFFVTATSFPLAKALVQSLKSHAICKDQSINELYPHANLSYEQAVKNAFGHIRQNTVVSSWKDALVRSELNPDLLEYIEIPQHGCLKDVTEMRFTGNVEDVIHRLWSIGGDNGWYYMHVLWKLRGYLDRICGGVGLRRGRRDPHDLKNGDALDFWRVLLADKENGHLILYAEMKLPGEAWLEFKVTETPEGGVCTQTASFRPHGLFGRTYWYSMIIPHHFIFHGMCHAIVHGNRNTP